MSHYFKAEWNRTWKSKDLYILCFLILSSIVFSYVFPSILGATTLAEMYPLWFLSVMISTAPWMLLSVALITLSGDVKEKTITRAFEAGLSRNEVFTVKILMEFVISFALILFTVLVIFVCQIIYLPMDSIHMDQIQYYAIGFGLTIIFLIPFLAILNLLIITLKGMVKVSFIYVICLYLDQIFGLINLFIKSEILDKITMYMPSYFVKNINQVYTVNPRFLEGGKIPATDIPISQMVGISLILGMILCIVGYMVFRKKDF